MHKKDLPESLIDQLFIGRRGPVTGRKLLIITHHNDEVFGVFCYPTDRNTGQPIRPYKSRQTTTMSVESLCHSYDYVPTVSLCEAARLLGSDTLSVEGMCRRGRIDATLIDGEWRVHKSAFNSTAIVEVLKPATIEPIKSESFDAWMFPQPLDPTNYGMTTDQLNLVTNGKQVADSIGTRSMETTAVANRMPAEAPKGNILRRFWRRLFGEIR